MDAENLTKLYKLHPIWKKLIDRLPRKIKSLVELPIAFIGGSWWNLVWSLSNTNFLLPNIFWNEAIADVQELGFGAEGDHGIGCFNSDREEGQ
jgi:hypothetical protein